MYGQYIGYGQMPMMPGYQYPMQPMQPMQSAQ